MYTYIYLSMYLSIYLSMYLSIYICPHEVGGDAGGREGEAARVVEEPEHGKPEQPEKKWFRFKNFDAGKFTTQHDLY